MTRLMSRANERRREASLHAVERPQILLAEDHRETRALLASTLRAQGYDVVEVASGYEFVSVISEAWLGRTTRFPDLVITDIRMPGPSGLRVIDSLRKTYWAIPVIVITAFGDAETHAEARRLGAHDVIDKPFDPEALTARVNEILGP
jgi:DNA-binding response OmpR family regulator